MAKTPARPDGDGAERPVGVIGSADNVLRLLRMFQDHAHIRGSEVSRVMGISPSTASRLLSTLQYHGFVEQDPLSRGYRAGSTLVDIGLAALREIELGSPASMRKALQTLKDETGETVHLAVLRGTKAVYIDGIESDLLVRTGNRVGWGLPAHATAAGRALLSAMDDDAVRRLYEQEEPQFPDAELTALLARLAEIRAQGYGVNLGETEPDLAAVGVALRSRKDPQMAVTVTAPMSRVDAPWAERTGRTMLQVVERIGL